MLDYFKKNGKIVSTGKEITVPSIFVEDDWKRHMSINLSTGQWQDFKSGERGGFIRLYGILKGLDYPAAKADIYVRTFGFADTEEDKVEDGCPEEEIDLIPITIDSCNSNAPEVISAWVYLYERKLFSFKTEAPEFFISSNERFKGRVIIPYFDKDHKVFFYQGRTIVGATPKYISKRSTLIKQSDLLYPFDMGLDYVVVCEGPLDAISLQNAGVNATCTTGCHISTTQGRDLRDFGGKVIIGFDGDAAGLKGLRAAEKLRKSLLMPKIHFCFPPPKCKDWNEALLGGVDLKGYILKKEEEYTFAYNVDLVMGLRD